jgi:thymidylate synthase (FAD)
MSIIMENNLIPTLDKGYVRFIDSYGGDLAVVNSARASYNKEVTEISQADAKLIRFLVKNGHFSTLRHSFATLEIKAPLMIARQWWKYIAGSNHADLNVGWNEGSRRYITSEEEFYEIKSYEWRSAPENSKQGSGEPVDEFTGAFYTEAFKKWSDEGYGLYKSALENGICAEQARVFLPAYSLYVNWRWTCSLQALLHFLQQRFADDAQKEIQEYAHAVYRLTQPRFPITFSAMDL